MVLYYSKLAFYLFYKADKRIMKTRLAYFFILCLLVLPAALEANPSVDTKEAKEDLPHKCHTLIVVLYYEERGHANFA